MTSSLFGSRSARRPHLAKVGQSGLAGEVADLRQDVEDAFQAFDDDPQLGLYLRTVRTVTPTGTSADAANIQAALTAMAGVGEVRLKPGTFTLNTKLLPASKTIVTGHPNATLLFSLTPTGGPGGYLQSGWYAATATDGTATTLAATPTVGAYTISVTASIAAGKRVFFGNTARNTIQQALVLAVSGAGPYTLTLDRPVSYAHTSGDAAAPKTCLTDFHIFGNGMKITGTGDRAIEFSGALRCSVNEVNIVRDSGVFEAFGASFDVASTEVAFRRVSVDGGAGVAATPTSVGLAMEAVVDGVIDDCVVTHIGASGAACAVYLPSTRAVTVSDTRIRKSYRGISLCQSGTGDTESSRDTHIRACDIEDTTTEGVIASGGVVGLQITDTVVRRATTYGMYLGADPDGSPLGVTMTDCETSDCGSYGLGLAAGVGIFVTAHRSNNNTSGALYLRASAIVRGMQAAAKGMIVTDTGSWTALLSGLDMTVPAGQNALTGNATCDLTVTDSVFRLNATANWCDWQAGAGTLRASNVRTTGGNYGLYMAHTVASVWVRGPNVDLSSCTTPYTFDASSLPVYAAPFIKGRVALTYSATIATFASAGDYFTIVATNGTAYTISSPTNPAIDQVITYDIKNSSGGAMGAITWGAAFLLAGAFTNPANTKRRTISFVYDGTNWVETNRAAADI